MVTTMAGKHVRRLYCVYDVDNAVPGTDRPAHLALQELFSGKKNEVTFGWVFSGRGWGSPQTWKRLGQETLMIGGFSVDTMAYLYTDSIVFDLGPHVRFAQQEWELWFDPSTGVFVKGKLMSMSGPGAPPLVREWMVISITKP
jgi:hypothetical protein